MAEKTGMVPAEAGRYLLRLARLVIAGRLGAVTEEPVPPTGEAGALLRQPRGVFVTLKIAGQLRGCIGSLNAALPLRDGVRENALNAAFHDPRFAPLTLEELPTTRIEISVLSQLQPLPYGHGAELPGLLRPGRDGVWLEKGGLAATFLPQVWQQLPEPEKFLAHLCLKAGLAADAWRRGDLIVKTYQVQAFAEDG